MFLVQSHETLVYWEMENSMCEQLLKEFKVLCLEASLYH